MFFLLPQLPDVPCDTARGSTVSCHGDHNEPLAWQIDLTEGQWSKVKTKKKRPQSATSKFDFSNTSQSNAGFFHQLVLKTDN